MGDRTYFYIPPLKELNAIPKPSRVKGGGYCGIAAMSAAISIPPLDIYEAIPDWPGYTPSRMIIKTLNAFGFECIRTLVPKQKQRQWPHFIDEKPSPSVIALGRIYYGEGKFADSHWICFKRGFTPNPMLYDNALASLSEFGERWIPTADITFYGEPAKLKSLYFVRSSHGK